jgi:hypothetical protein
MAVYTLRPSVTIEHDPSWVRVGGTTAHGVLADDTDATYLRSTSPGRSGTFSLLFSFSALPTLPGGLITAVRLRQRARAVAGTSTEHFVSLDTGGQRVGSHNPTLSTSWVEHAGPWLSGPATGGEWTPELIATLTARVWRLGTQESWLGELYLDIDYNEAPTPAVTGPADPVTDTTRPTVTWTYTDAEGDPQEGFRVRVFSRPAAGWPAHAGALASTAEVDALAGQLEWGVGWTYQPATREQPVGVDLDNGVEHRAYVQVRQGAPTMRSGWAWRTFTIDLLAPDPPAVVATPEPEAGRVRLDVADPGGVVDPEWWTVEYRDGDAGAWQPVRGTRDLAADTAEVTVYDHEVPFGTPRTYRVRGGAIVSGQVVAGAPTVVDATVVVPAHHAWVTDPLDPPRVHGRVYPTDGRQRTWVGREAVHVPAEMDYAVVEAEVPYRRDTVELLVPDPAAHALLVEALATTRTLLYRDGRRECFYFRWVGDRAREQLGDQQLAADVVTATQQQVAAPPT